MSENIGRCEWRRIKGKAWRTECRAQGTARRGHISLCGITIPLSPIQGTGGRGSKDDGDVSEILSGGSSGTSIRELNTIWFSQANFLSYCVKMLMNPSGFLPLFPCLTKKFALWKLCNPARRKNFVFSVRKGAARLTPCKTDNPKRRNFGKCRAYGVQLSNA